MSNKKEDLAQCATFNMSYSSSLLRLIIHTGCYVYINENITFDTMWKNENLLQARVLNFITACIIDRSPFHLRLLKTWGVISTSMLLFVNRKRKKREVSELTKLQNFYNFKKKNLITLFKNGFHIRTYKFAFSLFLFV